MFVILEFVIPLRGETDCRSRFESRLPARSVLLLRRFAEVSAGHPHRNDEGADYRFIAVLSAAKKISPHTFHHCAVIFLY